PGLELAEGGHVHQPAVAVADETGAAGPGGTVGFEDHTLALEFTDVAAADLADPLITQVTLGLVGVERVEQGYPFGQQFAVHAAGADRIADLLGDHDGHLIAQRMTDQADIAAAVASQVVAIAAKEQFTRRDIRAGTVHAAAVAPAHGARAAGGPDLRLGVLHLAFVGELVPVEDADVVAGGQPGTGQVEIR